MDNSNAVIYATVKCFLRAVWWSKASSWGAPGVTSTTITDRKCSQPRGSAAPPAPSRGDPRRPWSTQSGSTCTYIYSTELYLDYLGWTPAMPVAASQGKLHGGELWKRRRWLLVRELPSAWDRWVCWQFKRYQWSIAGRCCWWRSTWPGCPGVLWAGNVQWGWCSRQGCCMAPVCQGSGKSFDKIMSSTACACIL